jgi:hypothetical protein
MKRIAALPLVLLFGLIALAFGSIALAAQTSSQNQPQKTVTEVAPPPGTCPVSLHARHAGGGEMWKVDGVPINGISQMLHLIVTNPDSRRVVAANVTVRGFADKGRLLPAMSTQDGSDAAKTLDVKFPSGPGKETTTELRVPGLTAVTVIDLNSVTYSDGSSWKLAPGNSCRSWVDGLMLVSSH